MIGTFRTKVTDKTLKHMATYTRYAAREHVSRYAYFCVKPALVTSVINQDGRVRLLKTGEGSQRQKQTFQNRWMKSAIFTIVTSVKRRRDEQMRYGKGSRK